MEIPPVCTFSVDRWRKNWLKPVSESLQSSAEAVHLTLFWIMALLVVIHVAAALWHHFARHDTILRRMLPFTHLH